MISATYPIHIYIWKECSWYAHTMMPIYVSITLGNLDDNSIHKHWHYFYFTPTHSVSVIYLFFRPNVWHSKKEKWIITKYLLYIEKLGEFSLCAKWPIIMTQLDLLFIKNKYGRHLFEWMDIINEEHKTIIIIGNTPFA